MKKEMSYAPTASQNAKLRKVRSKSPTQGGAELATKHKFVKMKKFYGTMIPAFTNKKRQNSYFNNPK